MLPTLYSFRRCPYAMRARMAVWYSGVTVELREVLLKSKPPQMLQCSAKGTVPVLVLPTGEVIDESWDVMVWALSMNDPNNWMPDKESSDYKTLIRLVQQNDDDFKGHLDRYKYADRFPEHSAAHYRGQGEQFLSQLEEVLQTQTYLLGDYVTVADVAIMPFIRQFAHVDLDWFTHSPYPKLQTWLQSFLQSALFGDVMRKYSPWSEGDAPQLFSSQ